PLSARYGNVSAPVPFRAALQAPEQGEHDNHDEDQAERSARVVTTAGAVTPGGQRAEQQQNEDDDEDGAEHENGSVSNSIQEHVKAAVVPAEEREPNREFLPALWGCRRYPSARLRG